MKLYTLGYQGLTLSDYTAILQNAGVRLVIDVRENPFSVKAGFSKTELRAGLKSAQIGYEHIKSVGNPFRLQMNTKPSVATLRGVLHQYRNYLKERQTALSEVWTTISMAINQDKKVCLTCLESSPQECHRSVLVEELCHLHPDIEPIHLTATTQHQLWLEF
jgi:uncharacterized protein (DUF488 family)